MKYTGIGHRAFRQYREHVQMAEGSDGCDADRRGTRSARGQNAPFLMEMVETIVQRELPEHFDAIYEAKGVWNSVQNTFRAVNFKAFAEGRESQ